VCPSNTGLIEMLPQEFIRQKRDGKPLDPAALSAFIAGVTDGRVSEGQAAAFAMAVFFRGMSEQECADLTIAMRDSGRVLDWSDLPGPVLDKHSTGGVGDVVSLMLAPAVAAAGGFVPMISGRGLGHTGGTLDKLDSIPGYRSQPDEALFRKVTREAGCAIIGQTADLAPADRRLYAIRDVTATVESVPLITASILSKKLAAGLSALVLDVKFGSGAFMRSQADARKLAERLTTVSTLAGLPAVALLTDMNEPLASVAGNALEVRYTIDYLTGRKREKRLHEAVMALGSEMLRSGGLAKTLFEARAAMERAVSSGKAAEVFSRMVVGLGGPKTLLEKPDAHLAQAPVVRVVEAPQRGVVAKIDTRALGLAVVTLGGGRRRADDKIDPAVGLSGLTGIGQALNKGDPLAIIHARDEASADAAEAEILAAYRIGRIAPQPGKLVAERVGARKK
jgi:thymidine phosphorylase